MGPSNRLRDGLAILRAIAQSDAVKDVRERLREGAMAIAESERVPRVLSASAGIVAALLDQPAEVYGRASEHEEGVDSWSVGDDRGPEPEVETGEILDAEPEQRDLDDEEFEPDEAASLRDLHDEAVDADELEEQLLGATEQEQQDDEDDGEGRLLRFETQEADAEEPSAPAPVTPAEQEPAPAAIAVKKGRSAERPPRSTGKKAPPKAAKAKAEKKAPSKAAKAKAERKAAAPKPAKTPKAPRTPDPSPPAAPDRRPP